VKNPKFKEGDSVRILDPEVVNILGFRRCRVAEIGKRFRRYRVLPAGPGMWSWWIKEKDLELVSPEEPE